VNGPLERLHDPNAWAQLVAAVRQTEWVVYAKRPFAGPQRVLEYVGRYTHRVAISNDRVLDMEGGHVRFIYKDYRADPPQAVKTMTLTADEFIRRFLLHVLPIGFHRIRYYAFLAPRQRRTKLARCRELIGSPASITTPGAASAATDYRDRSEALTGLSLRICPACHHGQMIASARLLPVRMAVLILDTS
jgi:hypothetical protein